MEQSRCLQYQKLYSKIAMNILLHMITVGVVYGHVHILENGKETKNYVYQVEKFNIIRIHFFY